MRGLVPFDTTVDTHAMQRDIYQRLGGSGRVSITFRLNEAVRRLTMSGIHARHPHYSDAQVQAAYARLVLGDTVTRAVWPDRDLVDP